MNNTHDIPGVRNTATTFEGGHVLVTPAPTVRKSDTAIVSIRGEGISKSLATVVDVLLEGRVALFAATLDWTSSQPGQTSRTYGAIYVEGDLASRASFQKGDLPELHAHNTVIDIAHDGRATTKSVAIAFAPEVGRFLKPFLTADELTIVVDAGTLEVHTPTVSARTLLTYRLLAA